MRNWPFIILGLVVVLLIVLPLITSLGKALFAAVLVFVAYKLFKYNSKKTSES